MSEIGSNKQNAGPPASTRWERAYQVFETPEQELHKFAKRLRSIGAHRWDRRARILEVCSGRGTGLRAWQDLGFTSVVGVDYSAALVFGNAHSANRVVVGDARHLPLATASVDVGVVQGGLHHLFTTDDVDKTLAEMCRVLTPSGRIIIIEPWLTPFLRLVHFVCQRSIVRRLFPRIDALATMIEEERETYERWLHAPQEHLTVFRRHIVPQFIQRRWGKLIIVGSPAGS
jgi:ubiquinone/menaquinone biosynthesis C-methylase UbiE